MRLVFMQGSLLLLSALTIDAKISTLGLDFNEDQLECVPCNSIFTQLDKSGVQDTEVHLRGEPKSGTGLMYYSVIALLETTCSFLEQAYGPNVCEVETVAPGSNPEGSKYVRLSFNPLEKSKARREATEGVKYLNCPCNAVKSVRITYNSTRKHDLPVDDSCPWQWQGNVVNGRVASGPCSSITEERKMEQHPALVRECIEENDCEVTDTTVQSFIVRDPRASVVSAYFHLTRVGHKPKEPLDEWVIASLPNLCKRVLVRLAFFDDKVKDRSIVYRYEEAIKNPEAFHRSLGASIGLDLPDFLFKKSIVSVHKPLDVHIGGVQQNTGVKAGFEAEIQPGTLTILNGIMRRWFSEEQLAQWGIKEE